MNRWMPCRHCVIFWEEEREKGEKENDDGEEQT